jgi:hypothetical protein
MYCWAWIVVELLGQVPQQAHTQSLGMQWVGGGASMQCWWVNAGAWLVLAPLPPSAVQAVQPGRAL